MERRDRWPSRNIADAVVVITGVSSGIGRATALKIAVHNGTVVLGARQEPALQKLAEACGRMGAHALAVKTDVTQEEEVHHLAQRAIETYGRIDAWVNNAAVTMIGRFEDAPAEGFRRVVETNFFGYVHGARAVLPYYRQQGHGVLIHISSVLGKVGAPYATAYVASQFAITGFAESLRMELRDAPDIHVCTVLPATIDTPLFQHAANYSGRAIQPPPPIYEPEEVAEAIVRCIARPQREVTVGKTRRIVALRRMAPPLGERVIAEKIATQHFQDNPAAASPGNVFAPMSHYNSVRGGWKTPGSRRRPGVLAAVLAGLAGATMALYLAARRPRTFPTPTALLK